MRFGLLGPLEVSDADGNRRDPAAARQRRLLLGLLVWRGEPVSADRLVDVLWPDGTLPKDPLAALRTYVTRLRRALEPDRVGGEARIVIGGPDRYAIDLTGHDVDTDAFERDLAAATEVLEHDPGGALAHLDRGLARWRGPALADVADDLWAQPEAARLEGLRVTAEEHRLRCLLDRGSVDEAVVGLERQVRTHPLRERPHGLLMLALDRAGRGAEASEVFHAFRERLRDESGLDPSDDLQQLHLRLLSRSDASTFASLTPGRWDRVPVPRTRLIGRDRDIAALWSLVAEHRVVTITGAGGVGKTRLAAELAHRTREAGGDVAFAELAPVSERDGIVDAAFGAVQLPAVGRREGIAGLSRLLHSRRVLLTLDNSEHLADDVADVVAQLTRELPELVVLVTSREPLGVDGEHVYRVPSLDEGDAEALFRERALAAGFSGPFEPGDGRAIREICRRLDGIPLAIEFAAARVAHVGLAEIAERLDERFWLLAGGGHRLARHQTLEAAIAWSYDLLDAEEQAGLRAASAFVNGFSSGALADVAGQTEHRALDVLMALGRKSLIEADHAAGRPRYRLLETVRLFALERLHESGEAAATRQRHAEHFLRRALASHPQLDDLPAGVDRSMCRIRLDPIPDELGADLPNHLATLRWLDHTGDVLALGQLAARMPTVLGYTGFLDPERRFLGRDDVAEALADLRQEVALYQTASALNACYLGDFPGARRFGQQAMVSATDPATRSAAAALTALASTGLEPGRVAGLVDRALAEAPEDARFTRVLLRGQKTLSLVMQWRLEEAVERLEPHARLGDAFAAAEQVLVLHVLDEDERALRVGVPEDAYPGSAALWSYRWPLVRALAAAARGEHAAAAAALVEASRQVASSPVNHDHDVLLGCAALAYHAGDALRALQLLGAVGRRVISPGSFVLSRHYRALAEDAAAPNELDETRDLASELDPRRLLHRELHRLTAAAPPGDGRGPARRTPAGRS